MKKFIFLLSLILIVGCMSVLALGSRGSRNGNRGAQNTNNQNRRASPRQNGNQGQKQKLPPKVLRGLDLSDTQRQQIKDIRTAAKEDGTDRATVQGQIRGVLTEEQAAKFDKKLEKIAAKKARKKAKREKRKKRREENQQTDDAATTDDP